MKQNRRSPIVITLAIGCIIAAMLFMIFGSYLPLRKSQRFIRVLRGMSSIKTVGEFTRALESVLTFTSPVGQEEVVKFSAGNILDILSQKGQPEEASRKIAEYIEPYLFKDDVRHLLTLAQIYAALWRNYGREEYFQKAESYYRQGLSISPKMPPLLYGLFGLYGAKGDAQKISEIGTKILTYWPNDASISRVFNR